jgi:hypothetical protein
VEYEIGAVLESQDTGICWRLLYSPPLGAKNR